jgi:2-polyprenyl-3-methyl-5-hydroxy-6-metoxy-1,4-benzoquinol methylase
MPETVLKCSLCNSNTSKLFDRRTFNGQVVENRLCMTCGFIYQSPRMTPTETEVFYASQYRQMYQGESDPNPKDLAVQAQRAESLVKFTRKHVSAITRLLDIGCSAGLLLQAFHREYGCQPLGIEPGLAYREFALKTGFRIQASLQELISVGEQRFDMVSIAHVLEHIHDPLTYLVDLREQVLEPDGWLLLEVPNVYVHDSFEVAHLVSFSSHTLRQVALLAGYEVIILEKHGRPRSPILPYYLTMLCRPAIPGPRTSMRPEHAVRLKRQLGLIYRRGVSRLLPSLAWNNFSGTEE